MSRTKKFQVRLLTTEINLTKEVNVNIPVPIQMVERQTKGKTNRKKENKDTRKGWNKTQL